MSSFKVKTDAWHFKWLRAYNVLKHSPFSEDNRGMPEVIDDAWLDKHWKNTYFSHRSYPLTNFCMYWRNVLLWPGLRIAFNILLVAVFAFVMASVNYSNVGIGVLILGSTILAIIGLIGFGVLFFYGVSWTTCVVSDALEDETNIFGAMKKSYKEKFCPIVEADDEAHTKYNRSLLK